MPAPTERAVRCRYLGRNHDQCTAEAADPNGEILLCTEHLGRAWELIRSGLDTAKANNTR